ncbi:MAG: ribose-phosphate pyrophosphokinase [Erythrobacter sp.]|uniref:ribose-phosphate pyrophosphokinase n=1 Tax=Erythrobacter sp. TaxID=1042 RepID=UPI003C732616
MVSFDPAEVRAHLVAAARERVALTYSELLGQLGHRFTRPLMRQLCKVLDAIDEDGRASGEPGLAVLVVRQSDGLPGQGWFVARSGADPLPADWPGTWEGPKARAFVERRQREAFAYWQADRSAESAANEAAKNSA